jgi:hypothetical protein
VTVDDLHKSITFYEALGLAIDEPWDEKGTLLGVMLRGGTIQIGLNQDDWKKGRDRKKGIGVRLANDPGIRASVKCSTCYREVRAFQQAAGARPVPAVQGVYGGRQRQQWSSSRWSEPDGGNDSGDLPNFLRRRHGPRPDFQARPYGQPPHKALLVNNL